MSGVACVAPPLAHVRAEGGAWRYRTTLEHRHIGALDHLFGVFKLVLRSLAVLAICDRVTPRALWGAVSQTALRGRHETLQPLGVVHVGEIGEASKLCELFVLVDVLHTRIFIARQLKESKSIIRADTNNCISHERETARHGSAGRAYREGPDATSY